jgi:dynein heavy chain, axonemal
MVSRVFSEWMSQKMWGEVCRAATMSTTFKDLPRAIRKDTAAWKQLFDASEPQNMELPGQFSEISTFEKLLVIRMIRPDKLVPAVCTTALQPRTST